MKQRKSAKVNQQDQNGHSSLFNFNKLLDPDASWDKDQLGDVLHWIRQAVALACGLLWGAIPLVGGVWLFVYYVKACIDSCMRDSGCSFLAISTAIVYGYYAMILKIDEEEFGGHGALLQEGLFASITLFLVHLLPSAVMRATVVLLHTFLVCQ
ncbi:GEL complex subunit OPTI-like protein [Drosera capensis]